jgi:hypothetical protein
VHTFDLGIVALGFPHQKRGCFTIKRVCGVGVSQELWEKDFEDVDHVVHWRPCLVDDVEADGAGAVYALDHFARCSRLHIQLIDIRVEDPVHKADTWTFVRVLIG